jgi:hypothetical protein
MSTNYILLEMLGVFAFLDTYPSRILCYPYGTWTVGCSWSLDALFLNHAILIGAVQFWIDGEE